ncbi:MAG: hypothetical protein ACRDCW_02990 [Sarcina sp.]
MRISARVRDLFKAAGFDGILRDLEYIDPDKFGINYIDFSMADQTQLSFITRDKLKRFYKDEDMANNYRSFKLNSDDTIFREFGYEFGDSRVSEFFEDSDKRKKYGTRTKIGRFLRKFFSEDIITTNVIEKLMSVASEGIYGFRIVEGEEIGELYNIENYAHGDSGELGDSCMNDDDCIGFFGVYEENARMLVLFPKDSPNYIVGRAILWEDVNYSIKNKKIKIMDRIYTSSTELDYLFKQWAVDNGFYYKVKPRGLVITNGVETLDITGNATVDIGYEQYRYYPYVDTFSGMRKREDGMYQLISVRESDFYPLLHCTGGNTEIHRETPKPCSCCGNPTFNLSSAFIMDEHGKTNANNTIGLCEDCMDKFTVLVSGEGRVDKMTVYGHVVYDKYSEMMRGNDTNKNIYYLRNKNAIKFVHRENGKNVISYAREYTLEDLPVEIMSRNEETGIYEYYNSKPCPICGNYHDEFKMVAVFDKDRTFRRGDIDIDVSFKSLPVCVDCFNERVENGEYHNIIESEDYRRIRGNIAYTYGHGIPEYVDLKSAEIKCHKCGCETNVVKRAVDVRKVVESPANAKYWFGRIQDTASVLCKCCGDSAIKDYIDQRRD